MKIWITRHGANAILFGGLERLDVWFVKPRFVQQTIWEHDESPFGSNIMQGCFTGGFWEVSTAGRVQRSPISFGNVFGYNNQADAALNQIASLVWTELCKHFKNEEFGQKWEDLERAGTSKQQDFLLELDLRIGLIEPTT